MKKKVKRAHISLSLPVDVLEELDRTAREFNLTRTGVITIAMKSVRAFRTPELENALDSIVTGMFKDIIKDKDILKKK